MPDEEPKEPEEPQEPEPPRRRRCFHRGVFYGCVDVSVMGFSDGTIYEFGPMTLGQFLMLAGNTCQGCVFNALWRLKIGYRFLGYGILEFDFENESPEAFFDNADVDMSKWANPEPEEG